MAEAFLGYVLPWGKMSFWAATGYRQSLRDGADHRPRPGDWIRGDYRISDATLNRFFCVSRRGACRCVLLILVAMHLMALHEVGSNNPDGIEIKEQPKDPRRAYRSTAFRSIRITRSRIWSGSSSS